jgi:hypothetical protein
VEACLTIIKTTAIARLSAQGIPVIKFVKNLIFAVIYRIFLIRGSGHWIYGTAGRQAGNAKKYGGFLNLQVFTIFFCFGAGDI